MPRRLLCQQRCAGRAPPVQLWVGPLKGPKIASTGSHHERRHHQNGDETRRSSRRRRPMCNSSRPRQGRRRQAAWRGRETRSIDSWSPPLTNIFQMNIHSVRPDVNWSRRQRPRRQIRWGEISKALAELGLSRPEHQPHRPWIRVAKARDRPSRSDNWSSPRLHERSPANSDLEHPND
jgi:hypothetical protein